MLKTTNLANHWNHNLRNSLKLTAKFASENRPFYPIGKEKVFQPSRLSGANLLDSFQGGYLNFSEKSFGGMKIPVFSICAIGSINSHCFHIIGAGHQPNSRGLNTHYKDCLLRVG